MSNRSVVVAAVVAVLVTLAPEARADLDHAPAAGTAVVPVTVEVSAFWEVLDRDVCPRVSPAGAARPVGVAASDWTELRQYCAAPGGTGPGLTLAGRPEREAVLALIISGRATDRATLCAVTREQLGAGPPPVAAARSAMQAFAALCDATSDDPVVLAPLIDALVAGVEAVPATTPGVAPLTQFLAALNTIGPGASRGLVVPAGIGLGGLTTPMIDTALKGLAQFLMKRAELELRSFAIDKLRAVAECKDDTVRHRLLADSCEFLGGTTGTLTVGFGPGLRAAFARDLMALPSRLVREAPARGGSRQLVARVALEGAAVLLEDPEPMQLVVRLEQLARVDGAAAFACEGQDQAACLEAKAGMFLAATLAREVLTDGVVIRISGAVALDRLLSRLSDVVAAVPPSTTLHAALAALVARLNALGPAQRLAEWRRLAAQVQVDVDGSIASFREARRALTTPADATMVQRLKAAALATRHASRGVDQALAIADCLGTIAQSGQPARCTTTRTRIPARLGDLLDAIAASDLAAVMAAGLDLARNTLTADRLEAYFPSDMQRLLSFAAELANAKTADEAAAAIEAIALPPGGWKEKRRRDFFSITGLIGAGGGVEYVPGTEADVRGTAALVGAIGVDYNFHTGCSWFPSLGVFVPVLDLGGLLNVGDEGTTAGGEAIEEAAPVGVAQVFAPGIGLRVGLGDSPLVVLLAGQVVPNGRLVTNDRTTADPADDTASERTYYRAMASLAVDVTLWAF